MFVIYKLISPSGRYYIGLTKKGSKERWRQHVKKALKTNKRHPLLDSIRKYGPDSFLVEEIDSCQTFKEAQQLEMKYIAEAPDGVLYNLTSGGETDSTEGSKRFWEKLNSDPITKTEYLSRLSQAKLDNDWSDYEDMSAKAAKWRQDNPRLAWKLSYRAIRIAQRRRQKPKEPDNRPLIEILRWKHNRSEACRIQTIALWENYSEQQKAEIASKISETKLRQNSTLTHKERCEMTEHLRKYIDRSIQGPAASRGLKKFWEDIKKDPIRYAEYMKVRTASLMKTLEVKKCALMTS